MTDPDSLDEATVPADVTDETVAEPAPQEAETVNPLRGSRTSGVWVGVTALAVILVLLVVFIAQNTARVSVKFFGWTWHAPLAVVILTGVVAGMVLAVVAGTMRIWQLHRRVRRAG